LDAGRMHRSHVQKSNVGVHARLRIYVATLADLFTSVGTLTMIVRISLEVNRIAIDLTRPLMSSSRGEVGIDELLLSVAISLEHDLRSVCLRRRVDRKTTQVRQNLSSHVVVLTRFERRLSGLHVISAVVADLHPLF